MQRIVDEAEYVLAALRRMRNEVSSHPELFDPDAQERIDQAIVRMHHLLQSTQSQLIRSVKQEAKAA